MLVNIDEITVKKRVRKDLGDLEPLKDSLRRYGLLNPVTLTKNKELIAGERRLEAAKAIGWTSIQANIIDKDAEVLLLEMELEENNQRKEFSREELLDGYMRLDRLNNPGFFSKMRRFFKEVGQAFGNLFRRKKQ